MTPIEGEEFDTVLNVTGSPVTLLESLLQEVIEAPADDPVRLVAADCAEEAGRPWLAECLRWMYEGKKEPDTSKSPDDGRVYFGWWYEQPGEYPIENSLPIPWPGVYRMRSMERPFYAAWGKHGTKETAYRVLWDGWEEERRKGTKW